MVDKKRPVTEINAFLNNAITDKQIKTTKLLSSDEALMEFREYEKKLTPTSCNGSKSFIMRCTETPFIMYRKIIVC